MVYEEIIELVKKSVRKTAAKTITEHIAVEFDICGEGEGAFYAEINGGTCLVEPYEYYDRDAKIITSGEELKKIIKGEKTLNESIADGTTTVEGDVEAVITLLNTTKPLPKKSASKKTAKKTTKAEKEIVEMTKASKKSTIAKDIKK